MIGHKITPKQVLYEYDGPVIFIATLGVIDFLFYKAKEEEDCELFVASEANEEAISLLVEGKISVFGALRSERVFIFKLNNDFEVTKFERTDFAEINPRFLPKTKTPLYAHFDKTVDYIEQASAFFSIRYEGKKLSKASIPMSRFNKLFDMSAEVIRKLLNPLELSRMGVIDYPMYRPAFSSLIISVGSPILNVAKIENKTGAEAKADELLFGFIERRKVFFDEVSEVVDIANRRELRATDLAENFDLINSLRGVIPTSSNELESVEFVYQGDSESRDIRVDGKVGDAIEKACKDIESIIVTERGTLNIINRNSSSFVMSSHSGRQITCYVNEDDFNSMLANPRFRPGVIIAATGKLERRTLRDLLIAIEPPFIR